MQINSIGADVGISMLAWDQSKDQCIASSRECGDVDGGKEKNGKKKGEVLSIAEKKKEGKILKKTATKIEFKWGAELNVRKSWR